MSQGPLSCRSLPSGAKTAKQCTMEMATGRWMCLWFPSSSRKARQGWWPTPWPLENDEFELTVGLTTAGQGAGEGLAHFLGAAPFCSSLQGKVGQSCIYSLPRSEEKNIPWAWPAMNLIPRETQVSALHASPLPHWSWGHRDRKEDARTSGLLSPTLWAPLCPL